MKLSIVVPVYNNARFLAELSDRVDQACMQACGGDYELLLVDDGSGDASWQIIGSLASQRVRGLRLSRNFGQHAALKAGFAASRGDYVIMMDADLEDDPLLIIPILAKLEAGADICFTVATAETAARSRWTSRLFHRFSNNTNAVLASRTPGTMRGFNRKVRDAILQYGERRPIYGPLISGLGFRQDIVERPVAEDKHARSSYSFRKRLRLAIDHLIGYTNVGATVFLFAGFFSFAASLVYIAVLIAQYFLTGRQLPPGLSLIALLMTVLFSLLFLGVGMIALYLQRLLVESLARPLYLVSESVGGVASSEVAATRNGNV